MKSKLFRKKVSRSPGDEELRDSRLVGHHPDRPVGFRNLFLRREKFARRVRWRYKTNRFLLTKVLCLQEKKP